MSMIIDGTNGLTFNNATTQASAGQVLQVVNATYSTQINYASSTLTDTGLTASITPKFATSKILVIVNQSGVSKDSGNTGVNLNLFRGSTQILANFGQSAGYTGGTVANDIGTVGTTYLDSPATTSATTYKTQFASNNNVANAIVQQFSAVSTITLMEIAT